MEDSGGRSFRHVGLSPSDDLAANRAEIERNLDDVLADGVSVATPKRFVRA
jgi:hypothetical protein